MLDIQMEPRRGILFIRLSGPLNRNNINLINQKVLKFVKKLGIRNIVFNLEGVYEMDKYGLNVLVKSNHICLSNKGQMFICVNENKLFNHLNFNVIKSELEAINLINS